MDVAVIVRNFAGEAVIKISPVPNTVSDLKTMIQQDYGTLVECQKLVHADMGVLNRDDQTLDGSKPLEINLIVHPATPLVMLIDRFNSEALLAAEQMEKLPLDFQIHSNTETLKKKIQTLYRALVQSRRRVLEEASDLWENEMAEELFRELERSWCTIQGKVERATSAVATLFPDGNKLIQQWLNETIKDMDKELHKLMWDRDEVICLNRIDRYVAGVALFKEKLARLKVSQDSKAIAFAQRCLDQAKLALQAYEAGNTMQSALQECHDAVNTAEQTLAQAELKGESEVIAIAEWELSRAKQQHDQAQERLEDAWEQFVDADNAILRLAEISTDLATLFAASRMIAKAQKAKRKVAERKTC